MRDRWGKTGPAVVAVWLIGCAATPGRLVIDLKTDWLPGRQVDEVRVLGFDGDGAPIGEVSRLLELGDPLREGHRVGQIHLVDVPQSIRLETVLLRDGTEIVRQVTLVRARGAATAVTILITQDCQGVLCSDERNEACLGGRCMSAACTAEEPNEPCAAEDECTAAADCPMASGCSRPSCVAGACFTFAGDSCGMDEYCEPTMGCLPADEQCSTAPPAATSIAHYRLEGNAVDEIGNHPGMIVGSAAPVPGPEGCDSALELTGGAYVEIPNSPAWDLTEGSISFMFRLRSATASGLLSRDATLDTRPGHLTVFASTDQRVALRIQNGGSDGTGGTIRCSETVSVGDWHRVLLRFGSTVELIVDGRLATFDGEAPTGVPGLMVLDCGTGTRGDLGDNDNPWVLGASSHRSPEGTADNLVLSADADFDELRISAAR